MSMARFAPLRALLLLSAALAGCPREPEPADGGVPSDVPGLDAPGADVPGLDAPSADVPGLDAPGADVPGLDAPGTDVGPTDGGMIADGGVDPTDPPPVITICAGDALPSLASGAACEATAGTGGILVTADVLLPSEVLRGGQVLVDATGTITCVGCDCSAGAGTATRITCPDGVVSPGLVNAHEHITFHGNPYSDMGERYEHRHEWRTGRNGHTRIPSTGGASVAQIQWGELRMVLGGATAINGSGSAPGFLRNLDRAAGMEGLSQPAVDYDTFPLGDSAGMLISSGCGYPGINTTTEIAGDDSYTPHLSEGISLAARNEFLCVSMMNANDLIEPQTAFIHGVGLSVIDISATREGGSMLIWSPRSNVTLYGDTARVAEYDRLGVPVALGTDWIHTGSMNMLRELQCADGLDADYFDDHFDDRDLWLMATRNGAVATATDDVLGTVATGRVADLALFDAHTNVDYRAVIDAGATDVVLVLRSGRPLYGDSALVTALAPTGCDALDVCGSARRVCAMGETGSSLAALTAAAAGEYPLFFCGAPTNEPSCHPRRPASVSGSTIYTGMTSASDLDGDGIANAVDLCPDVFDPIRPMDSGEQPDFDLDGIGDACDPCPFDVTSACALPTANDRDVDGVDDSTDNCVGLSNPTQTDTDGDLHGDACDACPTVPNPGSAACPATIYDVKDGSVTPGSRVTITNGLVTARISNGFFMQVVPGDAGYAGSSHSGIFVFTGAAPAAMPGDRVTVDGLVQDFFGQLQLSMAMVTVTGSGGSPPAPIDATPAEVGTGGSRAGALEGVLVRVGPALVTALNTTFNEFTLDSAVAVDDAAFLAAPFPVVGQRFVSVTGVLAFRNSNSKILPRNAADLVGSSLAFGPTASFTRVGATNTATFPGPLTVTLASAPASDTFVAITSDMPSALTVVGGGVTIMAGMTSAQVRVDGLAAAGDVTLTATLGTEMATAHVGVLGAGAMPSTVTLSPSTAIAPDGATVTLTARLDLPASTDTTVTLAVTPAGAASAPATVVVPADQLTATFDVTLSAGAVSSVDVTATLGGSSSTTTITVSAGTGGLVINEVDYDSVGTDTAEFIELYNAGTSAVSLAGVALVRVNGMGTTPEYGTRIVLSGTLPAGAYLVIANPGVTVEPSATVIRFTAAMDNVQNGAPDGLMLIDTTTMTLIDALSYEGSITAVTISGLGTHTLVEGTVLPTSRADISSAPGSLARFPNGTDTNDAESDWAFTSTPTPGNTNVP